ncbi:MAG TPA: Asp-tRNA(Asn)/Glu-tRNA(Gln) amidotransferase subunit GatB [Candidatus Sulfotelmatobacter sp.]|jgi:aspartyl-tRNA(Asn)/glutamyl-tRNA(Gln) amidotransferase subunit B|nr:Asp-tRNA(Asn)/Glu-tRNA(Gln) amidotransferase subunit GatB [Candidatus Sulfotelmatobacter sp.]
MSKYTPVIGLEVHVELKTKSKMFCSCLADYFGKEPNSHTCPVCLGLPGALPIPNKLAIEWCIKIALALNCKINKYSKFDRKNYFYPDLAKGYQISQYDLPFGKNGFIQLRSGKIVHINRVHMEEDTGKLSHQEIDRKKVSLIDFNRSGVPLVEIVTEPDFDNATDVKEYLEKLQQIVRYLDVANADMEKGEMRLEPNISLTTELGKLPNYKVEVKNINSFKFVEKAINFEIERQQEILENNEKPAQETRGWNENKQKTFSQRSKEEAHDYRYFPEPDIPPIVISQNKIDELQMEIPELPDKKQKRFEKDYALPAYNAEILTREKSFADYFEKVIKNKTKDLDAKSIANWIINKKINYVEIDPEELLRQIAIDKQVSSIDETQLVTFIDEVISENEKAVTDYKNGKEASLMFLLGKTMKKIGKKVDTKLILETIKKKTS